MADSNKDNSFVTYEYCQKTHDEIFETLKKLEAHVERQDKKLEEIQKQIKELSNGYKTDLADIFIKKLKEENTLQIENKKLDTVKRSIFIRLLGDIIKIGIGVLVGYLTVKGLL